MRKTHGNSLGDHICIINNLCFLSPQPIGIRKLETLYHNVIMSNLNFKVMDYYCELYKSKFHIMP